MADGASAVGYVVDRDHDRADPSGPPRAVGGGPLAACTDEEFRGRGNATAIVTRLLEWFVARGITVVDLHASHYGVGVYRRLGFAERAELSLRWHAPTSR